MGQDGYSTTVTPPLGSDPLRPNDKSGLTEIVKDGRIHGKRDERSAAEL